MEMKHKKSGYGFKDPSLHCATAKAKATRGQGDRYWVVIPNAG